MPEDKIRYAKNQGPDSVKFESTLINTYEFALADVVKALGLPTGPEWTIVVQAGASWDIVRVTARRDYDRAAPPKPVTED
jgi:hypothetical protein